MRNPLGWKSDHIMAWCVKKIRLKTCLIKHSCICSGKTAWRPSVSLALSWLCCPPPDDSVYQSVALGKLHAGRRGRERQKGLFKVWRHCARNCTLWQQFQAPDYVNPSVWISLPAPPKKQKRICSSSFIKRQCACMHDMTLHFGPKCLLVHNIFLLGRLTTCIQIWIIRPTHIDVNV